MIVRPAMMFDRAVRIKPATSLMALAALIVVLHALQPTPAAARTLRQCYESCQIGEHHCFVACRVVYGCGSLSQCGKRRAVSSTQQGSGPRQRPVAGRKY